MPFRTRHRGSCLLVAALLILLFKAMWRVAEPNQALIVSGRRHRGPGRRGPRVPHRHRAAAASCCPGVQVVRRLSLDLNESGLDVECVTRQGIPVHVKGVVIFKVGDDYASIANAARRFLDQQDADGRAGPQHLRRPPALDRRHPDRRGDDPRARAAHRADPGHQRHRDGEARPDHRLAADPGDRRPDRVHQGPGGAARRRGHRATPASRRPPRTRGHRGRGGGQRAARPRRCATPASSRPATRPRWSEAQARARQAGPLADAQRPAGRRGPGDAASPSWRRSARSSSCRSRSASRPTPRPTRP